MPKHLLLLTVCLKNRHRLRRVVGRRERPWHPVMSKLVGKMAIRQGTFFVGASSMLVTATFSSWVWHSEFMVDTGREYNGEREREGVRASKLSCFFLPFFWGGRGGRGETWDGGNSIVKAEGNTRVLHTSWLSSWRWVVMAESVSFIRVFRG